MKIVAIGCIHNDIEKLPVLLDKIEELKPNVLIMVGDVLDAEFPPGIKPIDVGRIVIKELKDVSENVLITPGTWDKELIGFYKKEGLLIHGTGKTIENVGFYGFGGAKTPFNTPYEPEEEEIYQGLVAAYKQIENSEIKIQMSHAPPIHTSLDLIPTGEHVGSKAVRKAIEELKPNVAVCAHIHEGRGIDVINKTQLINVGKFTEGYAGIIDIKDKNTISVEIVSLI